MTVELLFCASQWIHKVA